MKIYYHPTSTTSRPVMLFAAEHGLDVDYQSIDLFTGEHLGAAYAAINPSAQVPVLEDEDFRLTECSAILKYLAEKVGSDAYPTDPRQRARVNERMDWFNTGLYRDLGYGLIYPQVMPHHRRPDEQTHAGTIAWGREKAHRWLAILDQHLIGPNNGFACGNELTIADYLGAGILTVGEVIGLDYSAYPNIRRWLDTLKRRPSWDQVNAAFYAHLVAPFSNATFIRL
jgi:glutathione S-transferase